MNLIIDYPETLPDALQMTRAVFETQARFAMAAMLYHEGKLSSGQAAALARMDRVAFLLELPRHGLSLSNLTDEELIQDIEANQAE